jgi:hypothetical protein
LKERLLPRASTAHDIYELLQCAEITSNLPV